MKIERYESKNERKLNDIIGVYIQDKLMWILNDSNEIKHECSKLYCNYIRFMKLSLSLYTFIDSISRKYNIRGGLSRYISNKYRNNILNIYGHIIERHEYILRYRLNNIFNHLCNDIKKCQHSIRNRNIRYKYNNHNNDEYSDMMDEIHDNIVHYNNIIDNKHIKHNKFITELNDALKYDYGKPCDYFAVMDKMITGADLNTPGFPNYIKISPKYGTLKEEMLCNNIERISPSYWDGYYNKAFRIKNMETYI